MGRAEEWNVSRNDSDRPRQSEVELGLGRVGSPIWKIYFFR